MGRNSGDFATAGKVLYRRHYRDAMAAAGTSEETTTKLNAMYEALVNSSPPLPPQGDWDEVERRAEAGRSEPIEVDVMNGECRPKWDSRAAMREVGEEAIRICTGDRNADYGPPEENHANTALLWNAYLNMIGHRALSGYDVCQMMADVKKARNEHKRKKDNTVDQLGYILNSYGCL